MSQRHKRGGQRTQGARRGDFGGDSVPSPISHHSLGFQVLEENHFLEIYVSLSLSPFFFPSICLPPSFSVSVCLFYIEKRILKDLRWHVLEIVLLVTLDLKRTVTLSRTGQHPVTGVSGHKGRGGWVTRWAVRGPEQEQEEEELFKIPREKITRLSQGTQDKYLTNNFLYKNITSHMIPFLLFKIFFQSWKQTSTSQCGKWSMSSVSEMLRVDFSFHELLRTQRVCVSPQGSAAAYKHSDSQPVRPMWLLDQGNSSERPSFNSYNYNRLQ